jgi:hypothetical protein
VGKAENSLLLAGLAFDWGAAGRELACAGDRSVGGRGESWPRAAENCTLRRTTRSFDRNPLNIDDRSKSALVPNTRASGFPLHLGMAPLETLTLSVEGRAMSTNQTGKRVGIRRRSHAVRGLPSHI